MMGNVIRLIHSDDGVHYQGLTETDEVLVNRVMLAGVNGSPAGWSANPIDTTLGAFIRKCMYYGWVVVTAYASWEHEADIPGVREEEQADE